MGDRTTPQDGKTAHKNPHSIEIIYNAEIKDLTLCEKIYLFSFGCSIFDKSRSYLYLREGSLETNCAIAPCCGCCKAIDFVRVSYFDRRPWTAASCCFCCNVEAAKLEVVDLGMMCCCTNIDPCCCGKRLVLMPFENFPFPCCCCRNRVGACDNCFGLFGQVTGNPKYYYGFFPQPADPQRFAAAAQSLIGGTGVQVIATVNNNVK